MLISIVGLFASPAYETRLDILELSVKSISERVASAAAAVANEIIASMKVKASHGKSALQTSPFLKSENPGARRARN